MTRPVPKAALSAAVLALIAAGAGGLAITEQFTTEKEGLSLSAYQVAGDRLTICYGRTEGVKSGDTATLAECRAHLRTDVSRRLAATERMVGIDLPPATLAAYAYTIYNMGEGNFRGNRSGILAAIRRGDGPAACELLITPQMRTVRGKDCAVRSNNCYGVWIARQEARQLCLAGYGVSPDQGSK